MFFLKELTAKPIKGPTFISSDMHAIPKVPVQVALIEIKKRICHWEVAFHWISLSFHWHWQGWSQ